MTSEGRPQPRLGVTWLPADELDDVALARMVSACAELPVERVAVVRACRSCGSDQHGKPQVLVDGDGSTWHVSLSRSGGQAVVAVTGAGPVGIDVEAEARTGTDLTTWVRKESLVKATGHGLSIDPATISLTAPAEPPELLEWPSDEPIGRPVWMTDLDAPHGYVAAATVLGGTRPHIVTTQAAPGE